MHRHTNIFALIAALCLSAPARAEADSCLAITITGASDLDETWSRAVRDLQKQLPVPPSRDCAVMALSVQSAPGGEALLLVTAHDGRHAERHIDQPSALGAIALGIIATLPPDIAPAPSTAATPTPETIAAKTTPSPVESSPTPTAPSASTTVGAPNLTNDEPTQIWLTGGLGARVAAPTSVGMLDLEARGDVEVKKWFFTVSLRYGSSIGETLTPHDASYDETAIGIGVGRTIPLGHTRLELAFVPAIASVNIDDADDADGGSGSRSELRLGGSVRWSVPLDPFWRFTISADSDFAPRNARHYVYVESDLPPLPLWTGGLRIGAAGKLL